MSINLSELVMVCFNIDRMLAFYQNIIDLPFEEVKIPQGRIYIGFIDEIQVTLCPASTAGIKAKDNRHQLTVLVDDIKNALEDTNRDNGSIMQGLTESKDFWQASIREVDGIIRLC